MAELLPSGRLQEFPERAYDTLTTVGEHLAVVALQQSSSQEHWNDPVQIDSILKLQSLAMGSLRHIARTRLRPDAYKRRHGFAIKAESMESDEVYDGATEEYLSYRVAKSDYTHWSMRVRFRQNERIEEKKNSSVIDDYYFSWHRDRVVVAANVSNHEISTDSYTSTDEFYDIHPLSDAEVHALRERMYRHVEESGAWPEDSFLKDAGRYKIA